jgi:hypothetical protein
VSGCALAFPRAHHPLVVVRASSSPPHFFVHTCPYLQSRHHTILPKKRWHVWNMDNVERVLKDERIQAEKEAAEAARVQRVEQEARVERMKMRYAVSLTTPSLLPHYSLGT